MPRIIVEVMPKPEILDPQGQAILQAFSRLGVDGISDVRQGKRFELEVASEFDEATAHQFAQNLLANTIIEDFRVYWA